MRVTVTKWCHSCILCAALRHGRSLSQYLLVQKQPVRPVFDIIIIENRSSIKSAVHQVRSIFSLTCQLR